MKGVVTSGGRGTRLRPITHTRNKHLVPVANKPMLHYALENLAQAGVRDVAVIVPKGEDEVPDAIGDGARWGLRISYIGQEAPRGLAHCILLSEEFVGGEPFIFYLGDNMVLGGVGRFVERFNAERCNCLLTVAAVADPERFGVPEIRDGRIVRVEEKPAHPRSRYAIAGIYLYDGSIFEAARAVRPSARGELEISDAHQLLIDAGRRVVYAEITGWWKDTGKPSDLLEANALILSGIHGRIAGEVDAASAVVGEVIVEEGARVIGSRIEGPAIIGAGSIIERSQIGPFTSLGAGCRVRNSGIGRSLVMANCSIMDVRARIEESIIGDGSTVAGALEGPGACRLITGDQSTVEML